MARWRSDSLRLGAVCAAVGLVATGAGLAGARDLPSARHRSSDPTSAHRGAVGHASARPSNLIVGIGEQKQEMFSDPRFLRLHLRYARRTVAWDALDSSWQRQELDRWLRAAHADGVSPLLTFDHSRVDRRHRMLPSPARLARVLRILRARYPWLADFATWNEANFCGEPTCHHPDLVAAYYRALRRSCPGCHVLGAELLDEPNMVGWVHAFQRAARVDPHYWGLHNYIDANRLSSHSTVALLHATRGEIWFTETAGLVARRNASHVHFTESAAHAARVTRFLLDRLARIGPRVTRVYLYEWNAASTSDAWDSALIGPMGHARPAYHVLEGHLLGTPTPSAG